MLELWGMQSIPSLLSLQGPLWLGVIAPDSVPSISQIELCPVSWGCGIHQLHLYRGVRPSLCPRYDTKQSDGEVPVMLELWGMQSTPSLPSLPDPLWPGVVVPDRVLSMGQIELNCVLMLNWIAWNRTVFVC